MNNLEELQASTHFQNENNYPNSNIDNEQQDLNLEDLTLPCLSFSTPGTGILDPSVVIEDCCGTPPQILATPESNAVTNLIEVDDSVADAPGDGEGCQIIQIPDDGLETLIPTLSETSILPTISPVASMIQPNIEQNTTTDEKKSKRI